MPNFKYQAINSNGETIQSTMAAGSHKELVEKLRNQKLYPVTVEEEGIVSKSGLVLAKKVKSGEIAIFLRQLTTLISTGVPIIDSISIITSQLKSGKFREVMSDVYENIHKGFSFSEALKKHPTVFSNLMVNMIESGEISGSLDLVVARLAANYEKDEKIKKKVKSALIYPIILSIVAILVVMFLLVFVMPTFIGMFESSGIPLPGPTKVMLAIGNNIRTAWYIHILIVGGTVFGIRRYISMPEGRLRFDHIKMKIPYLKTVVINLITARFARTLSTLLYSGVPLLDALENTARVIGNAYAERDIMESRKEVRMGHELANPIARIPYIPKMLSSMIKIGEESGALDDILEKTADFYESEVETSIQQMTAIFEPLLIVFMGIILGFIIVSMAMPMFDMVNTVA